MKKSPLKMMCYKKAQLFDGQLTVICGSFNKYIWQGTGSFGPYIFMSVSTAFLIGAASAPRLI